jgi:hypothetical protein
MHSLPLAFSLGTADGTASIELKLVRKSWTSSNGLCLSSAEMSRVQNAFKNLLF